MMSEIALHIGIHTVHLIERANVIMMISNNDDSAADALDQYIGNYRLLRLLGRGGFATVYLGEHRYLKRLSAIKVLQTVLLNDKEKERFLKEARLLANL